MSIQRCCRNVGQGQVSIKLSQKNKRGYGKKNRDSTLTGHLNAYPANCRFVTIGEEDGTTSLESVDT